MAASNRGCLASHADIATVRMATTSHADGVCSRKLFVQCALAGAQLYKAASCDSCGILIFIDLQAACLQVHNNARTVIAYDLGRHGRAWSKGEHRRLRVDTANQPGLTRDPRGNTIERGGRRMHSRYPGGTGSGYANSLLLGTRKLTPRPADRTLHTSCPSRGSVVRLQTCPLPPHHMAQPQVNTGKVRSHNQRARACTAPELCTTHTCMILQEIAQTRHIERAVLAHSTCRVNG